MGNKYTNLKETHVLLAVKMRVRVVGNYTKWKVAKSDTHPQVLLG